MKEVKRKSSPPCKRAVCPSQIPPSFPKRKNLTVGSSLQHSKMGHWTHNLSHLSRSKTPILSQESSKWTPVAAREPRPTSMWFLYWTSYISCWCGLLFSITRFSSYSYYFSWAQEFCTPGSTNSSGWCFRIKSRHQSYSDVSVLKIQKGSSSYPVIPWFIEVAIMVICVVFLKWQLYLLSSKNARTTRQLCAIFKNSTMWNFLWRCRLG